jgi:CRISPR-associated protein Cmr2
MAISLGPVQDFIAAARKTRDLWAGSRLLSELSRAAARRLAGEGARLIFPSPKALDAEAGVANKLLVVAPTQDPRGLADVARTAAQQALERHADRALATAQQAGLLVDRAAFRTQIDGFLEWYAAWVPYSADDYAGARTRVERLLAGRKALRDFEPAHGIAGRPKSSLDPSRESVLEWEKGSTSPRPSVRDHEQLDAVSLVKRLGEQKRFRSVSRVAIDPLVRRLAASDGGRETLEQLRELAWRLRDTRAVEPLDDLGDPFPWDTELWYSDHAKDDRVPTELKELARKFYRLARGGAGGAVGELPAYYAVLKADGDRMGKLIGQLTTPERHQQLSDQLVEFTHAAEHVVRGHSGALIYSGGDDVLALVPLDQVTRCATKLRAQFAALVSAPAGVKPSLSVGLAVAHYNEPLTEVLRWAGSAEHRAKARRDAVALAVHTRSGGGAAVAASLAPGDPVLERLDKWVTLLRQEALPDGAAYELRALAAELAGQSYEVSTAEAERILRRKRAERGTTAIATATLAELLSHLRAADHPPAPGRLERLADELVVARHLAPATDVAEGLLPRQEKETSVAG